MYHSICPVLTVVLVTVPQPFRSALAFAVSLLFNAYCACVHILNFQVVPANDGSGFVLSKMDIEVLT